MQLDLRQASKLVVPADAKSDLLEFLCHRFAAISRQQWQHRFERQLVLDEQAQPLQPHQSCYAGMQVFYFREVVDEPQVPFAEQILFEDELLLAVDKPHFLTVSPVGQYVEQTLLRRLQRRFPQVQLSPLHRLDRLTAGVILFCKQPEHRNAYQQLFRQQQLIRTYEAIAAPLPHLQFPYSYSSRLEPHRQHFFLTEEVPGAANTQTQIQVLRKGSKYWHYQLNPLTGRKHQLRVHMHSLGASILNDDFYPHVAKRRDDDYSAPLQLLARNIAFVDPVNGRQRSFTSGRSLLFSQKLD